MQSNVDYESWLKQDLWTKYEASFLLCGLEPDGYCQRGVYDPTSSKFSYSRSDYKRINEMDSLIEGSIETNKLKADSNIFKGQLHSFQPQKIIQWALEKDLKDIPQPLIDWYEKQIGQHGKELKKRTHTSELLDLMELAIMEFWENHDPENPPSNPAIEAWLRRNAPENIDFSENMIKAICSIMRPEKYKKGNKGRVKKIINTKG